MHINIILQGVAVEFTSWASSELATDVQKLQSSRNHYCDLSR